MKMSYQWSTKDSWFYAWLTSFIPHPLLAGAAAVALAVPHGWKKHPLDKPMLLFALSLLAISLIHPTTSFLPLGLVMALVIFRQYSLISRGYIAKPVFVYGAMALCAIGVGEYIFSPGRVSSLTMSPNIFGIYMAVAGLIAPPGRDGLPQKAAAGVGLMLSGSRGAMLGLAAGVFSLMPKHKWLVVVVALIPAGAVMLFRPAVDLNLLGESLRVNFWVVSTQMFVSSPIYGHGFGSFTAHWLNSYPAAFPYAAAHSLWFNLLAEGGLLVAIPFGYLLLSIYLQLKPADGWQQQAHNAALVALAVHASVDTPEANILALTALVLAMRCRGEQWEHC